MTDAARAADAHIWEREEANWYVEPRWCTTALCMHETFRGRIFDPCAGMGNVIAGARAAGLEADGSDLVSRPEFGIRGGFDFLSGAGFLPLAFPVDNIITNPPYGVADVERYGRRRLEEQVLERALISSRSKVALFLRTAWLNSGERGEWLRRRHLYRVWIISPRPSCPPGHLVTPGEKHPTGGRIDYAWFVFLHGFDGEPSVHWLWNKGSNKT